MNDTSDAETCGCQCHAEGCGTTPDAPVRHGAPVQLRYQRAAGAIRLCFEPATRELLPAFLDVLDLGDLDAIDDAAKHLRIAVQRAMSRKANYAWHDKPGYDCPRGVEGCDGTSCTWECPDCGCQNCHQIFCYACGAGSPEDDDE